MGHMNLKTCMEIAYLPPKRLYHFIRTESVSVTLFYFANIEIIDFNFS